MENNAHIIKMYFEHCASYIQTENVCYNLIVWTFIITYTSEQCCFIEIPKVFNVYFNK